MNSQTLGEVILQIVDDRSGGAKLMEILPSLPDFGVPLSNISDDPVTRILQAVETNPKLGVLEYTMKFSETAGRCKWFVYRKEL